MSLVPLMLSTATNYYRAAGRDVTVSVNWHHEFSIGVETADSLGYVGKINDGPMWHAERINDDGESQPAEFATLALALDYLVPAPLTEHDRLMAESTTAWETGLRVGGSTGEHTDAHGVRHVATKELHPNTDGRPSFWAASCTCSFTTGLHYGSPFIDAAANAAIEWARHLPA